MTNCRYSAASLLLALVLCGCNSESGPREAPKAFRMGDRVKLGNLNYTVLDSEWLDQLGQPPSARLPRYRFLAVRLTVTNNGREAATIPQITLVGSGGQRYPELDDASALTGWLGSIRLAPPAGTLQGRVAFDAPADDYDLRLSSGDDDPERELTAGVQIPLQFGPARVPPTRVAVPSRSPRPAQQ